ncbi:D-alanine--D-alanine ligase [Sesbania bispinosa]|nr:D-alanine--D-alanine ligase [Sesbania bispinosa]
MSFWICGSGFQHFLMVELFSLQNKRDNAIQNMVANVFDIDLRFNFEDTIAIQPMDMDDLRHWGIKC